MRKRIYILAFFSSILFISCVEEYWPEIKSEHENLLVVDGKITNEPGPYTICLTRSVSLSSLNEFSQFNPETNAIVQIVDDLGNSETLTETDPGIYKTSETGIQGVIGRKYQLLISTANGKNYESIPAELIEPTAGIESVKAIKENHFSEEIGESYAEGFQFYVSTDEATNNKNYFVWELEETYEYHAPIGIFYTFRGYNGYGHGMPDFKPFENHDTLQFCWKTNESIYRYTYNTEFQSKPKVNDLPLIFIPINDERVKVKYSLLVKQYNVPENTYSYYINLLDQASNQEGLYMNQPYEIRGNMVNSTNTDESVLGYFMVAGTTASKRIFVQLLPDEENLYQDKCAIIRLDDPIMLDLFYKRFAYKFSLFPIYLGEFFDKESNRYIMAFTEGCIDCTKKGGSIQKPDFWND